MITIDKLREYGADVDDSMAYKLRPDVLFCMDRNYSYHFWMLACIYDNETNERLYPPAGANLESYAWQGDMHKFGIKFVSTTFPELSEEFTANNENVPKLTGNGTESVELFHYSSVRGWYVADSEAAEFARNLNYILQKKNGDGEWVNVDNSNQAYEKEGSQRAGFTVRPNKLERGNYRVLIEFNKIKHNTLGADGIPTTGWDTDVKLYDERYTEGVFYFDRA